MYATWNGEVINTVHRWSTVNPFQVQMIMLTLFRNFLILLKEKFEDNKVVMRSRKWKKTDYTMTKRKATRTPPKTGSELMCSGKIGSSGSLCDARCLTLVTNPVPVVSHEWGKNRIVIATQVLRNGWPMYLSVKSAYTIFILHSIPLWTSC
jgi:hypothetical protein